MANPSQPPLKIISLAILAATLIYVVVAFVLAQSNGWIWSWQLRSEFQVLFWVFCGLACVLAGAVLILSGLPTIPRLALAEAIAILGLVLAFLQQSPLWVLPFVGLSLVLQIYLSPFFSRGPS